LFNKSDKFCGKAPQLSEVTVINLSKLSLNVCLTRRRKNMELTLDLSLEQQFNLKMYQDQVKNLSQEQAQDLLLEVLQQLMVKDNVIRSLMKNSL
jgi:Phycobilisome degradation protein nblA